MGASDLTSADAIAIFSWDTSPLWRPFYAWGCNAFKSFLGMVLLESSFYITSPTYARRNGRPRAGIGPGQPVLLPRSQATAHNSLHAGHIVIRSPHQSSSWKRASGKIGFVPTCPSQRMAACSGGWLRKGSERSKVLLRLGGRTITPSQTRVYDHEQAPKGY